MGKGVKKASFGKELKDMMGAIGLVATSWAKLEHSINSTIWALSAMEDEDGACVTSQIVSFLSRMRALIALVHRNGGSKELLGDLNKFSVKADALGRQRNRIIHDPWYHKEDKFARLEITADRKLVFEHRPQTVEQVMQVAREISELIPEFEKLRTRLGGNVTDALESRAKAMVAEARAGADFSQPVAAPAGAMDVVDVLNFLVENGPGRTDDELVKAIWGARAGEPTRVRNLLQHLVKQEKVVALGTGKKGEPHRYYPAETFVRKSR